MIAIIVVLSLVWYGITQWLYLMSIASFLFAWVYILIENNSLPTTTVSVDDGGITVGPTRYDYPSIEKFSLISITGVPRYLRIKERKRIWVTIDIPLTWDVDSVKLREYIASFVEEDKNAVMSNSDAIIHAMRL